MFSILEVKRSARAAIKESLGSVIFVSLVYALIVHLLDFLGLKVLYGSFDYWGVMKEFILSGTIDPELLNAVPEVQPFAELLEQAFRLMAGIIGAGFTYFMLLISRRVKAGLGDMFDIFNIFLRALALLIITGVYIMLWSMLFVIPGIIAAYRYSMAIYILLDRPDVSVMDCIRLSKEMTYGNKGKLFLLDLSFAVWFILGYVGTLLNYESEIAALVFGVIITFVFTPYYQATLANVYNRLSGWRADAEGSCAETPDQDRGDASSWYDN